jgi:hypothetical protein
MAKAGEKCVKGNGSRETDTQLADSSAPILVSVRQ